MNADRNTDNEGFGSKGDLTDPSSRINCKIFKLKKELFLLL
jgi:hypothetical protein